jgi:uncharacterized protein YecE (DUF72 family)
MKIGTASWSIPNEFKEHFPEAGSHLERYSKVFNCVEINTTFYKFHRPQTFEKWASLTPRDFEFSLKLHRSFTHECDLKPKLSGLKNNLMEMGHLGSKWKVLLLQFPGKQAFDEKKMGRFYEGLRKYYDEKIVIEPRNLSWLSPESKGLLKEFKISKVLADPERCPHDSKSILSTGRITYFRLHGSPVIYRSSYSEEFIKKLGTDLAAFKNPWCIFDNTTLGKATGNALELFGLSDGPSRPDMP